MGNFEHKALSFYTYCYNTCFFLWGADLIAVADSSHFFKANSDWLVLTFQFYFLSSHGLMGVVVSIVL